MPRAIRAALTGQTDMESIKYDFDKNELNSDEMAICPSLESDLRALVSQVPRDMLPWLAGIAVEQAVRG